MEKKQTAVNWLISQIAEDQMVEVKSLKEWVEIFDQAKLMHKEEMVGFAEFVATHLDKNRNVHGEMLHAKSKYDGAERTIDLLEQYYNNKIQGGEQ